MVLFPFRLFLSLRGFRVWETAWTLAFFSNPALGFGEKLPAVRLDVPPRKPGFSSGSAFIQKLLCKSFADREEMIVGEILQGNFPESLRILKPVKVKSLRPKSPTVHFWVMPDYLGVGSEFDFVRTPVNFYSSIRIAEKWNMELPTPKMVDLIHEQSDCKIPPHPMPPTSKMTSTDYFYQHQQLIEADAGKKAAGASLLSGHKKDIVISNKLKNNPGRIAIYGWHQEDGRPIQPCSTIHGAAYADYSHGLRLIYPKILVNGRWTLLREALKDKNLSGLLSDEGPVDLKRLRPAGTLRRSR